MDYWNYLAHSQQGAERDNHRYYAREIVAQHPKWSCFEKD